jgi:hypothetical protein
MGPPPADPVPPGRPDLSVHDGALAYLPGINALRASEAALVAIEDYTALRGHWVLHLVGKGNKPATMPLTVPVLYVLGAGQRPAASGTAGRWCCDRSQASRSPTRRLPHGCPDRESRRHTTAHQPAPAAARRDHQRPRRRHPPARRRSSPGTTTEPVATSTDTASTSSPPTSPGSERLRLTSVDSAHVDAGNSYGMKHWSKPTSQPMRSPTALQPGPGRMTPATASSSRRTSFADFDAPDQRLPVLVLPQTTTEQLIFWR